MTTMIIQVKVKEVVQGEKGGPHSGNFDHAGIPGHQGGSAPALTDPKGLLNGAKPGKKSYLGGDLPRNRPVERLQSAGFIEDRSYYRDNDIPGTSMDWTNVDDYEHHDYIGHQMDKAYDSGKMKDPYQELADEYGLSRDLVAKVAGGWDGDSSSKHTMLLNVAASLEFGIPLSDRQTAMIKEHGLEYSTAELDDARKVVGALYDRTQRMLQEYGVKDPLMLMRGISYDGCPSDAGMEYGKEFNYRGSLLESWTTSHKVAANFGDIITATVPLKNIFACSRTGLGTLSEMEFVVIGNLDIYTRYVERIWE